MTSKIATGLLAFALIGSALALAFFVYIADGTRVDAVFTEVCPTLDGCKPSLDQPEVVR